MTPIWETRLICSALRGSTTSWRQRTPTLLMILLERPSSSTCISSAAFELFESVLVSPTRAGEIETLKPLASA